MENNLNVTLGFKNNYINQSSIPQFSRNINEMYIYTDLIDYTLINNIKTPLLRIIPFEYSKSFYRKTHAIFNTFYIKVTKREIRSIHFEIRTATGQPFPFWNNSKTVLTLHFKPV